MTPMLRLFTIALSRHRDSASPLRRQMAAWGAAGLYLFAIAASAQEKPAAPAAPAATATPEYAGSQACQLCHEDIFKAFQKSPHQVVESDKKRHWENRACESCHGPGGKHADSVSAADIRQPAKLAPAQADKICLTCHQNQSTHTGRIN